MEWNYEIFFGVGRGEWRGVFFTKSLEKKGHEFVWSFILRETFILVSVVDDFCYHGPKKKIWKSGGVGEERKKEKEKERKKKFGCVCLQIYT